MDTQQRASVREQPSAQGRVALFDVVRGFSVISMVLFHLCYDLRYLYGQRLDFFAPPLQDIWRASISWTFLFIAGCMCSLSRNNLKRSLRYLGAAAAVFMVTWVAAVDTPISFGIIFCMGASTLLYHLLDTLNLAPTGFVAALLLCSAFLLTRGVPSGSVGIGAMSVPLPHWLYGSPFFAFAGFPGPGFYSGDYYPMIPFTLMYLTGAAMERSWHDAGYPALFYRITCRPLQAIGRHALPIYILHQPFILAMLELCGLS